VSRLSNRRLELCVGADRLSVELCRRWPRRQRLARVERTWDASLWLSSPVPAADADRRAAATLAFDLALDPLLQDLAMASQIRGAALSVELSDAMAIFDVAQGDFAGCTEVALAAIADACTHELLGDAAEGHETRSRLQGDERHLLICALPRGLLQALREAALRHGLHLQQVQAQFAQRWDRYGRSLRRGMGVFASSARGSSTIALVRNGVIEALSCDAEVLATASPTGTDPTALDGRVDRLLAALGVDGARVSHFVAVDGERTTSPSIRWGLPGTQPVKP
jgi:hypothetical protein